MIFFKQKLFYVYYFFGKLNALLKNKHNLDLDFVMHSPTTKKMFEVYKNSNGKFIPKRIEKNVVYFKAKKENINSKYDQIGKNYYDVVGKNYYDVIGKNYYEMTGKELYSNGRKGNK